MSDEPQSQYLGRQGCRRGQAGRARLLKDEDDDDVVGGDENDDDDDEEAEDDKLPEGPRRASWGM